MSIPEKLKVLVGEWKGSNRLHLGDWHPVKPIHDSDASATVRERIGGQFIEIAYRWEHEGNSCEGVLILGGDNKTDAVNAFWTDSWHMAHQVMFCSGTQIDGNASVKGSYKVEGHPEWGWRTEIIPGDDEFKYNMYNISPEGEEFIAVEMELKRT
jgi:hypothetical protein